MKQVLVIINLKTIVITALAVASTYLCRRFEIRADFPMTLIENPFDQIGEDDIIINAEKFVERLQVA